MYAAANDLLKSDISLVHEIALKRKFSVEFEVGAITRVVHSDSLVCNVRN